MRRLPSTPRKGFRSSLEETSIDRTNWNYYDRENYTRESRLPEQKGGTSIVVYSLERGLDLTGVKDLKFEDRFNEPVEGLDLKGVETLALGWGFNQPIERLDLKWVNALKFDVHFNQPVERLDLKGVKILMFGHYFNQPIEGLDLKGVESLAFLHSFNQPIERLDLKGVKTLIFGSKFNQKVEGLDLKGIEILGFGRDFNQKVEGLDLKEVTSLNFGRSFNQKVENLDLKGVTSLHFGMSFNQKVENLDLKGVTSLHFGDQFNQPIEVGFLKEGLENLYFGDQFNQPIEVGFLKEGLEILYFGYGFRQEISPGVFPMSLEILESTSDFIDHPQESSLINDGWKKFKRDSRLIWSPVNAKYSLDLERFCNTLSRFHIVNIRHILDYFGIAYSETESRETLCNRLRDTISPYRDEPLVTSGDLESCDNTEDIILTEPLEGQPRSRLVRLERRDSRGDRLKDGCLLKDGLRRWLMASPNCYRDGGFNYARCLDPLNREPIPAEILDQIFSYSYEKDNLRSRYANDRDLI